MILVHDVMTGLGGLHTYGHLVTTSDGSYDKHKHKGLLHIDVISKIAPQYFRFEKYIFKYFNE